MLIDGVDNDLFWSGISDDPFRLLGISEVDLMPESSALIDPHPEWGGLSRFVMSLDDALALLTKHQAIVVELKGRNLKDITGNAIWRERSLPPVILNSSMWPIHCTENGLVLPGIRLNKTSAGCQKRRLLKSPAPRQSGQILEVTGYCPAVVLTQGPLEVSFRGDGIEIGSWRAGIGPTSTSISNFRCLPR